MRPRYANPGHAIEYKDSWGRGYTDNLSYSREVFPRQFRRQGRWYPNSGFRKQNRGSEKNRAPEKKRINIKVIDENEEPIENIEM